MIRIGIVVSVILFVSHAGASDVLLPCSVQDSTEMKRAFTALDTQLNDRKLTGETVFLWTEYALMLNDPDHWRANFPFEWASNNNPMATEGAFGFDRIIIAEAAGKLGHLATPHLSDEERFSFLWNCARRNLVQRHHQVCSDQLAAFDEFPQAEEIQIMESPPSPHSIRLWIGIILILTLNALLWIKLGLKSKGLNELNAPHPVLQKIMNTKPRQSNRLELEYQLNSLELNLGRSPLEKDIFKRFPQLTFAERSVLQSCFYGQSNEAIASGLGKSLGRIYNIRSDIKKKTNNDPLALDVLNGTYKPSNSM